MCLSAAIPSKDLEVHSSFDKYGFWVQSMIVFLVGSGIVLIWVTNLEMLVRSVGVSGITFSADGFSDCLSVTLGYCGGVCFALVKLRHIAIAFIGIFLAHYF